MLKGSRLKPWWSVAVVGVAALAAAGGFAYAAIPASDGTINACYHKETGALRVIDTSGESCLPSEAPISWNQEQGQLRVREVLGTSDEVLNTFEGVELISAVAKCDPDEELVTGGGFRLFAESRLDLLKVNVVESGPVSSVQPMRLNGWGVIAYAPTEIGRWGIDAHAVCTNVGGSTP